MHSFPEKELSEYGYTSAGSVYGGVKQQGLLIFSRKAYQRECKALVKSFAKKSLAESKAVEALCKQVFACQTDAQDTLNSSQATCQCIHLENTHIQAVEAYPQKGRPKKEDTKVIKEYQINLSYSCQIASYQALKKSLGFLPPMIYKTD